MGGKDDLERNLRVVRDNPSVETVTRRLGQAMEATIKLLESHEPAVKEELDAFVELGDRLREAEEVMQELRKLKEDTDQEGINAALRGAESSRVALVTAALKARQEIDKTGA